MQTEEILIEDEIVKAVETEENVENNEDETIVAEVADNSENTNQEETIPVESLVSQKLETVNKSTIKISEYKGACNEYEVYYTKDQISGHLFLGEQFSSPAELLEEFYSLFDNGFLEDEDGNSEDSIIIPFDALDLPHDKKGIIVDCSLEDYENGFHWMLNGIIQCPTRPGNSISNVYKVLKQLVKVIHHLCKKGYYLRIMDGHQLFYNVEYGILRFIYDGIDIIKVSESADSSEKNALYEKCVSALILYLLTGARVNEDESISNVLQYEDEGKRVYWDYDLNEFCGDLQAITAWEALPSSIRDALFNACLIENGSAVTFEQWEEILENAKNEIDKCSFCGCELFKSESSCPSCGKSTNMKELSTTWRIQNDNRPCNLKISFGVGTVLTGEILGINYNFSDFMRIRYNSKKNILGIQNLSGMKWSVTTGQTIEDLNPGATLPIGEDIIIEFPGNPGIKMTFLGFEESVN